MHGNIYERCHDSWHDNYTDAPTDGSAWLSSKEDSNTKLLRGGSWHDIPEDCRSASRNYPYLDYLHNKIGFRVVCSGAART